MSDDNKILALLAAYLPLVIGINIIIWSSDHPPVIAIAMAIQSIWSN